MKKVTVLFFLCAICSAAFAESNESDQRNLHIFCGSIIALKSTFLEEGTTEYMGLAYLARIHSDQARKLGATQQQFEDVMHSLKDSFNNDRETWDRLSAQAERLCFP